MCDYGESEQELQVFQWIRARKSRKCCACKEVVQAGQVYHRSKYLFDGSWQQFDHCPRCIQICEQLWERSGGDAINMHLDCGETWEEPPLEIAALAFELPTEMQGRAERLYADTRTRKVSGP